MNENTGGLQKGVSVSSSRANLALSEGGKDQREVVVFEIGNEFLESEETTGTEIVSWERIASVLKVYKLPLWIEARLWQLLC